MASELKSMVGKTGSMVAADCGLNLCWCVVIKDVYVMEVEQGERRSVEQDEGT